MKTRSSLFMPLAVALGLSVFSCSGPEKIELTGTVSNLGDDVLMYSRSVNGIMNVLPVDTLHLATDSTYSIAFDGSGYEKIRLFSSKKGLLGTLYLNGGVAKADINMAADTALTLVDGIDETTVRLARQLDDLQNESFYYYVGYKDMFGLKTDSVPESVGRKLRDYAVSVDSQFAGLDADLKAKLSADVRMNMLWMFGNKLKRAVERDDSGKDAWASEWNEMLKFCNIDNPASAMSGAFSYAADDLPIVAAICAGDSVPQNYYELPAFRFGYYEDNLTGKAMETAMALQFVNDDRNGSFNKLILPLGDRFEQLFPDSKCMPAVSRVVANIEKFNREDIPDGINYHQVDSLTSLNDILAPFKGKVVYIDIWHTGCHPCREAFKRLKPLQEYARDNDVVLMYISVDTPDMDERWRKMSAYYDLYGEHYRVDKTLHDDVYTAFGGSNRVLYLPHYAIIDINGEVRNTPAAGVEDFDALKAQLEAASQPASAD